jgi:Putative DNA-binding domain
LRTTLPSEKSVPTLRDLQTEMLTALLGGSPAPMVAVLDDGLTADARLAIYRHHVLATLTDVLRDTYPVVCRLLDERFFGYAADQYIRRHPPASPCLFEYGDTFAGFLATFPPCRHLPYLPDVARLEWAINAAEHAIEVAALDARALQGVDPADTPGLRVEFDPSLMLLESPWPIHDIWRANQPDAADGTVELGVGGVRLEVRRLGNDVVLRPLGAASWTLRCVLAGGRTLEEAAAAALDLEPELDLAGELRALLDEGLLTAVTRTGAS